MSTFQMNTSEGLRRLAQVIRWIGNGLAALVVLAGLGIGISELLQKRQAGLGDWIGVVVATGIGAAFFVYAAKAVAWIIDGFAKEK